jgi:hypothetical protein
MQCESCRSSQPPSFANSRCLAAVRAACCSFLRASAAAITAASAARAASRTRVRSASTSRRRSAACQRAMEVHCGCKATDATSQGRKMCSSTVVVREWKLSNLFMREPLDSACKPMSGTKSVDYAKRAAPQKSARHRRGVSCQFALFLRISQD